MNATELIRDAEQRNPGRIFALSDSGNAIGVWEPELGRFRTVSMLGLDGNWYQMKFDLRANGSAVNVYANAKRPV